MSADNIAERLGQWAEDLLPDLPVTADMIRQAAAAISDRDAEIVRLRGEVDRLSGTHGQAPICYGVRVKGSASVVGVLPMKVMEHPPTSREYLERYEEIPLYAAPVRESIAPAEAKGDFDATFAEWLATEMPAGTVIGNPKWWAERIARQYRVRSTSQPADGGAVATVLWCLHVLGPDEVHSAPSKAHAEQAMAIFNATFPQSENGCRCEAVVAPWPHSDESHAESVAEFIPNWLLPRWQVDAMTSGATRDAIPAVVPMLTGDARIPYTDATAHMAYKNGWNACVDAHLATHPAVDALGAVRELVASLRGKGDAAYVGYIRKIDTDDCRGWEAKVRARSFGRQNLDAFTAAAELLGRHRALHSAAEELEAALRPSAGEGNAHKQEGR